MNFTADSQALNLKIASKGLVLLKNIGNTLPIKATGPKTIAIIGPNHIAIPNANCAYAATDVLLVTL